MDLSMRKMDISARGGLFAAILFAAVFTSAQVSCLTHQHCYGTDCFEEREISSPAAAHGQHHDAGGGCSHEAGSSCGDEHQGNDIHHHSREGQIHPKRRFAAPAVETVLTFSAGGAVPAFCLALGLRASDGTPLLERYGAIFDGRAPPLF